MQRFAVVETELFERTLEDTIDYLWTKFGNEQAIVHLINGILKAKLKLSYAAELLPFYSIDRNEQYIQVDNMNYIIVYILDRKSNTVYFIRLAHYLQNR